MSSRKKSVLFVALVLALGVIGWSLAQAAQKHDAWILGKLKEEFAEDNKFDDIHFTVGAGFVSLKGSVALLEDKRQAARTAATVDHVRRVNNDITIATPRIRDSRLRMQLKHDLRKQGLNGLKLKVHKGVVTVRGTELSNRERILTLIASTEGVRGIRERTTLVE